MTLGFVLITAAPGKERGVYSELVKLKEVGYAQPTWGGYDFVVRISAENFSGLGKIVVNHIQPIPGVLDTRTLTVLEDKNFPSVTRDLESRTEAPTPAAA